MKCVTVFAAFVLSLPAAAAALDGVLLSIRPDPMINSDNVTICRVTALNHTGRTILGRDVAFEARAIENGAVIETEAGTFGGTIANGAAIETLIGFSGVFGRFEVSAVDAPAGRHRRPKSRRSSGRRRRSRGKGGR
jgi:hypothetical protein